MKWIPFSPRFLIPVYCLAGILFFGCETQAPTKPLGSGCEYRDIPGTCLVEAIAPSGPNTYGEGFRTLFAFQPDSDREASTTGTRMTIGDGKDPTGRYLKENGIEVGTRIRCTRKVRVQGPCSPEAFLFPDLKRTY
jgi:hypothetical protein